eukprot:NODE_494_length_6830_cov_0.941613.p6 type:complete len:145 gc:universal NODE_494_length_6830_cov_0.941613:2588-2154(-)
MFLSIRRSFYRFKLSQPEIDFILKYAPIIESKENPRLHNDKRPTIEERVEMLRRILSDDTASQLEASLAKKHDIPSSSSGDMAYQIRNLHIKIQGLQNHLKNNTKDFTTKQKLQELEFKQIRNMKYLKKKSPLQYVELKNELQN